MVVKTESERDLLLNEAYEKFLQVGLGDYPLDGLDDFVDENISGYGTTVEEKIENLSQFRDLILRQRQQGLDIEMKIDIRPVWRKILGNEDVAVITDEVDIQMRIGKEANQLLLRMTSVLENREGQWVAVHFHSSMPTYDSGEEDTWHIKEWQQREAELERQVEEKTADLKNKNRELEIESALEKVRSSALSMKDPDDMVEVCRIISDQLELLNVKDIRNIQTAIIDEIKGTYLNYEYFTQYKTSSILEILTKLHPVVEEFVNEILKSKDAFFTKTFKGKALKNWIEYRKDTNQNPDPILEASTSVHYYFYSIGPGALGISTYSPLNDEDINVFKRFRNVFALAYRRFIDIEKAIAQTREAQVEAALERVRSKTMAMHNSQHVGATVVTLFDEVLKLGLDKSIRVGIGILEGYEGMETWSATSTPDGEVDLKMGMLNMTIHPMLVGLKKAWKSGKTSYSFDYIGDDVFRYYEALNNEPDYPFQADLDSLPENEYHRSFFFSEGILFSFAPNPISDEAAKVLDRFARVFGQTYRRYRDLQKAEAQAREAQIELALERIRAQAMAMKESSDLLDIVVTMRTEFIALGHEAHYFWHMRWLPEMYEKAMTSGDGTRIGMVMELPRGFHENAAMKEWERNDEPVVVITFDANGAIDYVDRMIRMGRFHEIDHNAPGPDDIRAIGGLTFVMARTTHGEIGYSLPGIVADPPAEDLSTLVRFAGAFDLAYRRFEDLKEAEAHNKIIQVENERKTQELEEARQLQLAMLPRVIPKLPHHDIAVYMQTATEVSGDYYDFSFRKDKTLNVAIGDATGHGMKAGTLVTAMKAFFTSGSSEHEMNDFFSSVNRSIKEMRLERVMMGFAMLNINGKQVKLINAGMPPILHYNSKKGVVEEIQIHGMPLGAMQKINYKTITLPLSKGDVLLLLSDGMPELQNANGEMFGYDRVITLLMQSADKTPDEIIENLKNAGSDWVQGADPDDDVTFVVVKMK